MVTNTNNYQPFSSRIKLLKVAVLIFFIMAHWQTLLWLAQKSAQRTDITIIIILLVVGIGWVWRSTKPGDSNCQIVKPALWLLLTTVCAGIVNHMTIRLPQANLTFLLLGIYSWLGFKQSRWLNWSKALSIVLLLAIAVPFYLEFSSGLGFGLRLLTAALVEQTLANLGINAISSHDIIRTENAIAHIDIPCSGLKSLWVGSLFFLIVLIKLNCRLSWLVGWKYLAFILLLLSANTFRVLILTLLTVVYDQPQMAETFHLPLGILGFGISCSVAVLMLRQTKSSLPVLTPTPVSNQIATTVLLLIIALTGWQIVISVHHTTFTAQQKIMPLNLPTQFHPQSVSLTVGEQQYFAQSAQTIAQKWRWVFEDYTGSVLIVQSLDFNMFHAPELCMAANGITVDAMTTVRITPALQVRLLSLNKGQLTGIYWLQSGNETTDSFGERYWRYFWLQEKNWWMIAFMINQPYPMESNRMNNLTKTLYLELTRNSYETAIIQ
jgi:exosortase O